MKRKFNLILLIPIAVFMIGISTLALYMYNSQDVHLQKTNEFYFSSDYLAADTVPVYDLYGGGQQVFSFKLKNFEDTLRFSDEEITYTVKAIDNSGTAIDSCIGSISGGGTNQVSVSITVPDGYPENSVILVTAESMPFYSKLSAKLVIHAPASSGSYYIEDSAGQTYAKLTICANHEFTPTLHWIDGLSIDCTNPYIMNSDGSVNFSVDTKTFSLNKTIKKGESVSIYFFKTNLQANYSKLATEISTDAAQIEVGT